VPEPVSVASYNVYLGADLSVVLGERLPGELVANVGEVQRQLLVTSFPRRAAHLARALLEHEVDLIGLQEACRWTVADQEMWDFTSILQQALCAAGACYELVSEVTTFAGDGELSISERPTPVAVQGSNVVLRRAGSRVRVVEAAHGLFTQSLQMPALGEREVSIARGWCGVRCEVGETSFAFVDTHTEAYDARSRDLQRDELLVACGTWGDPLVLVGDFNATPDQVGMPEEFVDAWSVNGNDPGFTCCQEPDLANEESGLRERIDYVWVRGRARVRSAARLGAGREVREEAGLWPSDHAGVRAVIEIG
jgi:endonuclease/exonuclease/phosphatase family metal-dependent hydrolase